MKKPVGIFLSILCLFVLMSHRTFATTYYVDPSSTSATANGSLASPWKTIAQVNSGATALNPGDMVLFKRFPDPERLQAQVCMGIMEREIYPSLTMR